jgi:adenine-specific DNA-methyltransferase
MSEYEKHPTQKPIALLERIIKASSNEGDLILDPFSGTFTTSYVARILNRKSIGIEIDEDFSKIGIRRVLEESEVNGEDLSPEPKTYQNKRSK